MASATCEALVGDVQGRPDDVAAAGREVGISASNAVFLIAICRPSFAATALAASTSKPMAWFGSVTSEEGKYSIGGYSMSTQSTSCRP